MPATELDQRIMAYLRDSISERGGSGRRLSKIQWEMPGPEPTDLELGMAIRRLHVAGRIRLEEPFPGFVYAVPVAGGDGAC